VAIAIRPGTAFRTRETALDAGRFTLDVLADMLLDLGLSRRTTAPMS
jgi:hypothetical protein